MTMHERAEDFPVLQEVKRNLVCVTPPSSPRPYSPIPLSEVNVVSPVERVVKIESQVSSHAAALMTKRFKVSEK